MKKLGLFFFIIIILSFQSQSQNVTTVAASNLGTTSATLNGTITTTQGLFVSNFEYGLTISYGNSKQSTPSGWFGVRTNEPVSANISGLKPGEEYNFRLYAEPDGTPDPGGNLTFTTQSIAQAHTITFSNTTGTQTDLTVSAGGGSGRILVGVEGSSITVNPTDGATYTGNNTFGSGDNLGSNHYVIATGNINSVTIYGLTAGQQYTFKVFEYTSDGIGGYNYQFQDTIANNPNSVTTTQGPPSKQASNLDLNDNILSNSMLVKWTMGNGTRRIVLANTQNTFPTSANLDGNDYSGTYNQNYTLAPTNIAKVVYDGTEDGTTGVTVNGLNAYTEYYFKVIEYNNTGSNTLYHTAVTDTTGNPDKDTTLSAPPILTTASASGISYEQATMGGNVSNDGTPDLIERGILFSFTSLNATPELNGANVTKGIIAGIGTGDFSTIIDTLTPGTEYSFRTFARSATDTAYGSVLTFSTLTVTTATVTTDAVTDQTTTTATLGGNISSNGGSAVTVRGVCYSYIDNTPESGEPDVICESMGSGSGAFSESVTNLKPGVTYYANSFATNSAGTSYGSVQNFTTNSITQASNVGFNSTTNVSTNITFTKGGGSGRLVIAREGAAPVDSPVDGTDYTASTNFGSGTEIGAGNNTYVIAEGNITNTLVNSLNPETTYYFQVFEYTSNGVGGFFYQLVSPASGNVTTLKGQPTVQANNIAFNDIQLYQLGVEWVRGDASNTGVLVVARYNSPIADFPEDGTTYAANAAYGSGDAIGSGYVVYNGTGTAVDVTALSSKSNYYFRAFEYNNTGTNINYLTSTATDNPSSAYTLDVQPSQASGISFSNVGTTSMDISWTSPGDGSLVVVSEGAAVTGIPVDTTNYTADANFGSGDALGNGYIAYNGTGTSFTLSNLTSSSTYHVRVYSYNNLEGTINYNPNTASNNPRSQATLGGSAPSTQASNVNFTDTTTTSFTINWTSGNGAARIVAMKEGAKGTIYNPDDNTTYTASADWTSKGTQLGSSGYYVVHNGTGSSVAITNLSVNTNYWVQVFEYNGTSPSESYNISTATNNPFSQATLNVAPTTEASNLNISKIKYDGMTLTCDPGNGDFRLIVANTTNSFTTPSNLTEYSASTIYGSGYNFGLNEYAVYAGTGDSIDITGLSSSTTYYFKVWEYSNAEPNTLYLTPGSTVVNGTTTSGLITWQGGDAGDETNWHNAANWDSGIPGTGDDVLIPNVTNQPEVTSGTTVQNVTIEPGATLTLTSGTLTVSQQILLESPTGNGMPGALYIPDGGGTLSATTSTMERYLPVVANGWHLVSSPISSFSVATNNPFNINSWDQANLKWNYLGVGTILNSMQGYNMNVGSKGYTTITYQGTFNNGTQNINVANSNTSDNNNYGWNMIGNPYPSSIDLEQTGWHTADIDATVYVYSESTGTYSSHTLDGAGSFIIAPMQAFFVHLTGIPSSSLSITNAARSTTGQTFKSTPVSKPTIDLKLENNFYSSNIQLKYNTGATKGFDPKYDAYKLLGSNDSIPEFYSMIDTETLLESNVFPVDTLTNLNKEGCFYKLGFKKGMAETLTISVNELVDIPDTIAIYLIDNQENKKINLRTDTYTFSTAGLNDSRFEINISPIQVKVNTINITSTTGSDSVKINNHIKLTTDILPIDASNPKIIWSVDNSDIAQINEFGILSGVSNGNVVVTATATDGSGIAGSFSVKVYSDVILVNNIEISHNAIGDSISINSSLQLNATLLPDNATDPTFTWSVDDNNIAIINSTTGLLSGLSAGIVKVTATANDSGKASSTVTLKIYNPIISVDSIVIDSDSDSININETLLFTGVIYPSNATNQTFTWSVSNSAIASINESTGMLSAKSAGGVNVIATANDGSGVIANYSLTVNDIIIPADSIVINHTNDSLAINNGLQLSAIVYPENASNQTYEWSTSNNQIASVNSLTGSLSAKTAGNVIIYARANDNQELIDSIEITVYEPIILVDSIKLVQTTDSVKANNTIQMKADVYPEEATNTTLKWSVSDTEIATINKTTGLLTAKTSGSVIVIATANDNSGVFASITLEVYVPNILVDSLFIIGLPDSLETNKSVSLTALVYPADASNQLYTWSIDNAEIASINETTGTLTTKSSGILEVTATAIDGSGKSITQLVTVYQQYVAATNITLISDIDSIEINTTAILQANVEPSNASNQIINWSSSNTNIATIDKQTGLLSAKAIGKVIIKATSADNAEIFTEKTFAVYSPTILVSEINIDGIDSLLINESTQLSATILPSNASNSTVTWEVAPSEYATINQSGILTGTKPGLVTVTAYANDNSEVSNTYDIIILSTTSVADEVSTNFVSFYPNPTSGIIHINTEVENGEYTIVDNVGRILLKNQLNQQNNIDITELKQGSYFIIFTKETRKQVNVLIKK